VIRASGNASPHFVGAVLVCYEGWFLDNAVIQVARAIEIDHAKVLCYRKKSADLLMVAGVGWSNGVVGTAIFPSDLRSPSGRSFQTAEPVIVEDISHAANFSFSGILQEHHITSLANVPIVINGDRTISGPRSGRVDSHIYGREEYMAGRRALKTSVVLPTLWS
jgi:GAF domain-containing protein